MTVGRNPGCKNISKYQKNYLWGTELPEDLSKSVLRFLMVELSEFCIIFELLMGFLLHSSAIILG